MPKVTITTERKEILDNMDRIIGRRKRLRITQEQMAKQIGKARNTYSDMERNPEHIKFEDLNAILHELGLRFLLVEEEAQ